MSQEYEQQKIMQVDLEREMKKSYIDYAMSVIVASPAGSQGCVQRWYM